MRVTQSARRPSAGPYSPVASALPVLGSITATLAQASAIAQSFSPAPRFVARLTSGDIYFDSCVQLDTDGWPQGGDAGDPDWQPTTSLSYTSGKAIDANTVPYIVLPLRWFAQFGIALGDFAAVIYNGNLAFAVFADAGPATKLGEASLELFRRVRQERLRPDGTVINAGMGSRAITIVFPGSSLGSRPQSEATLLSAIDTVPRSLFAAIGGNVGRSHHQLSSETRKLFAPSARAVATMSAGKGRYHVVDLKDQDSSGQSLAFSPSKGAPKALKTGSTIFPLPKSIPAPDRKRLTGLMARKVLVQTPGLSVAHSSQWSHIAPELRDAIGKIAFTAPGLDQRILAMAKACDGTLITAQVPGTDHGNLACAWAVNEIVRRVTGRTVSHDVLGTDSIYDALMSGAGIRLQNASRKPGCIIISPSSLRVHGHVGILGNADLIYSNSSKLGKLWHSYTVPSWQKHYTDTLKLQTLFFDLNPKIFGWRQSIP